MIDITKIIDLDCEAVLLGTMLNSINAVNNAMESLTDVDFFKPEHRLIFRAIQALYRQDLQIEIFTIANIIQERNPKFDMAYLFTLDRLNNEGEGLYQIEKVLELSRMRKLQSQVFQCLQDVTDKKGTCEELASKLSKEIDEIILEKGKEEKSINSVIWENYRDSGEPFWKYLDKRIENSFKGLISFDGLPTHYSRLDSCLNGLNDGHFIVVGARPGVGKTTFVLNLMKKIAYDNKIPTLFFSLEMSTDDVALNLACIVAHVQSKSVRAGMIDQVDHSNLIQAATELKATPLYIEEQPSLRISQLMARAKRHVSVNGVKLIVIDYLTLICGDVRYANKQEEIAEISKSLRGLAKKLKVPIICLCQLNRESEKEKRPPTKADLRESGQIEQDAHSILMLHRPEVYDPLNKPGMLSVHIVKNRFGEETVIDFDFDKKTGVIKECPEMKHYERKEERNDKFDSFNASNW